MDHQDFWRFKKEVAAIKERGKTHGLEKGEGRTLFELRIGDIERGSSFPIIC